MRAESQVRRPETAAGDAAWLPLSSVSISAIETENVLEALSLGNVSGTGPDVRAFELSVAAYSMRKHSLAVNSGTSALEMALRALEFPLGSAVLVPSFTFAAPASAVVNAGLTPVLVDVDEDTWTISVSECRKLVNSDVVAVIAVDTMGNPCDYEGLAELGITIVEDAAQSLGAEGIDAPCGGLGQVSVLSFHANKVVTTGEGGMLLTDDAGVAERARSLVNHGMRRGYWHDRAGHNLRMANLPAALGRAQFARLVALKKRRLEIEERYWSALADVSLGRQLVQEGTQRTTWLTALRSSRRDEVVQHLRDQYIDARAVWPALSSQPFLRRWWRGTPVAEKLAAEVFWLPTYDGLTDREVALIANAIRSFFEL